MLLFTPFSVTLLITLFFLDEYMNVLYTILSINVKQKGVLTNEIYISCGFPQK